MYILMLNMKLAFIAAIPSVLPFRKQWIILNF